MEEDPDVVPGGDEGRRDGRATEPEGFLAGRGRWAQHEPVQGALVGLLHIKVAEAAGVERTVGRAHAAEDQQGMVRPELTERMAGPIPPLLSSTPSLPRV